MCLHLANDATEHVAEEDIICYKRLLDIYPGCGEYDKKRFTGVYHDNQLVSGTIYVWNNSISLYEDDGFNFLFSYYWCNLLNITSIIVDDVEIINILETKRRYLTPYKTAPIIIGETYKLDLIYDHSCIGKPIIEIGLHSFTNYSSARDDGSGVIVECIIPKGARYYKGIFFGKESYASDILKYVEIIEK